MSTPTPVGSSAIGQSDPPPARREATPDDQVDPAPRTRLLGRRRSEGRDNPNAASAPAPAPQPEQRDHRAKGRSYPLFVLLAVILLVAAVWLVMSRLPVMNQQQWYLLNGPLWAMLLITLLAVLLAVLAGLLLAPLVASRSRGYGNWAVNAYLFRHGRLMAKLFRRSSENSDYLELLRADTAKQQALAAELRAQEPREESLRQERDRAAQEVAQANRHLSEVAAARQAAQRELDQANNRLDMEQQYLSAIKASAAATERAIEDVRQRTVEQVRQSRELSERLSLMASEETSGAHVLTYQDQTTHSTTRVTPTRDDTH